jgi:hypothetical protein
MTTGTRRAQLGYNALAATTQGIAFYQGTNVMNNILYTQGSVFENALSVKENLKSIAFMGVLQAYGRVATKVFGKEAVAWEYTKPLRQISGKDWANIGGSLLAEAGVVVLASQGTEMIASVFGDNADFESLTIGEYLQAIALVALMKGSGKITIKK